MGHISQANKLVTIQELTQKAELRKSDSIFFCEVSHFKKKYLKFLIASQKKRAAYAALFSEIMITPKSLKHFFFVIWWKPHSE